MDNSKLDFKKPSKRSLARLIAVQVLYQYDFYQRKISIEKLATDLVENYFLLDNHKYPISYRKKIDNDFLQILLSSIIIVIDQIDLNIKSLLKDEQDINKLPDILLQILRLAAFEMKYLKDIPYQVSINEYVDIASSFYDRSKVDLVNAILENFKNNFIPTVN